MKLARIVGFSIEELNNGHIRVSVQYNGMPTPNQVIDNGKPPKGLVYKQLMKRGYFSSTGEVLKAVGITGRTELNDGGKTARVIYESREPKSIPEVIGDIASKIVLEVVQPPFQPNSSRYDPMSN